MSYAGTAPETPATPTVEASSWGRRLGAFIIDNLILGIPLGVLMVGRMLGEMSEAGMFEGEAAPSEDALNTLMADMMGEFMLYGFLGSVVALLYFVVMHGALGRTLGKMAVGIKVIKDDGTPCDFGAAFKRAVVYPIAGGVPYIGGLVTVLNGLWPLWDEKRQSLGDKLGATYVVRK
ncbi:MAG TPA: RDD family protein [Actinomycetota bacterium]|nr:RDD family protein [Actinomycetota bacterium]